MIHVIYMQAGQPFPMVKEFEDIDQVFALLKIKKTAKGTWQDFETMLMNDGEGDWKGIGIIARDQDKGRMKQNILGLKGDFVLIGMDRVEGDPQKMHMFQGLRKDQQDFIRKQIARHMVLGGLVFR